MHVLDAQPIELEYPEVQEFFFFQESLFKKILQMILINTKIENDSSRKVIW